MPAPFRPLPVLIAFPAPAQQRRWTVLIRIFLALPLAIVIAFFGVASFMVTFLGWFAAIFVGRTPAFVRNVNTIYLRMGLRLYAYTFFLTDRFPAFSTEAVFDDPAQMAVPEATTMNRAAVFFRIILVIPVTIVGSLVFSGIEVISVFMWFVVLVTGRLPAPVHQAFAAAIRYQTRLVAYLFLLVPTYPSGLFGDGPPSPGEPTGAPGEAPPTSPWHLSVSGGGVAVLILAIALGLAYQITFNVLVPHPHPANQNNQNNQVNLEMRARAQPGNSASSP
jgi:Domain of unknown function (DUF4389)